MKTIIIFFAIFFSIAVEAAQSKEIIFNLISTSSDGQYIKLSNGNVYKVSQKNRQSILKWSFEDKLTFYREGVIIWGPLILRNETKKDSIPIYKCK